MANNCAWASCGEWCLTRTSGFCPQIHTAVRRNGTDVIFENCTRSTTTNCPQVGTSKAFYIHFSTTKLIRFRKVSFTRKIQNYTCYSALFIKAQSSRAQKLSNVVMLSGKFNIISHENVIRHPHVYSSLIFLLITTPTNSPRTPNLFNINGAFSNFLSNIQHLTKL